MTLMLAKQKWQIRTIAALELVFEERIAQMKKHGDAMRHLPDGTGPNVQWVWPVSGLMDAEEIQVAFRDEYDTLRATPGGQYGQLTRMHLVREELAETFELEGNDPRFIAEAIQVAALLVQWVEYKLEGADV
jgi:hypothetical protein